MPTKRKPTKKKARAKPRLAVATVIQRLSRMEDLVIEMRRVLDIHLKGIAALQKQVDSLIEKAYVEESDEESTTMSGWSRTA